MRVGVFGATGRMGRMVLEVLAANNDCEVVWACGRMGPPHWDVEVVIDFSTPSGFRWLMSSCPVAVVSGTTGVEVPENPTIPLLHAPNFSIGVAVLAQLLAMAAEALPEFDAEIVEIHHSGKKDAPSGTALRLASVLGRPLVDGRTGPRNAGEVGMHAVRAGDVVGEHTVYLAGPGERLELRHVASNRGVFAQGAVRAARWLVGRSPGRYRLEEMLQPRNTR